MADGAEERAVYLEIMARTRHWLLAFALLFGALVDGSSGAEPASRGTHTSSNALETP